jgi:hypothetical protein
VVDLLAGAERTAGSVAAEIIIHLRADGITLHDGTPLSRSTVAGLIDEAFIRVMIHDAQSHPVDVSERHRHPTPRQKLVVDERHPVCADCGTEELLEYHHEPPFEVSGRTVIDELDRRCGRCHDRRHRGTVT